MRRLARRYIQLLIVVCGLFFTRKQGLVGVVGGEMRALEKEALSMKHEAHSNGSRLR